MAKHVTPKYGHAGTMAKWRKVGRRHQADVVTREKVGIKQAITMCSACTLDGSDWEKSLVFMLCCRFHISIRHRLDVVGFT